MAKTNKETKEKETEVKETQKPKAKKFVPRVKKKSEGGFLRSRLPYEVPIQMKDGSTIFVPPKGKTKGRKIRKDDIVEIPAQVFFIKTVN
jgi:hypothetical protein